MHQLLNRPTHAQEHPYSKQERVAFDFQTDESHSFYLVHIQISRFENRMLLELSYS